MWRLVQPKISEARERPPRLWGNSISEAMRMGPFGAFVVVSGDGVSRERVGVVKEESRVRDLVWRGAGARGVDSDEVSGFVKLGLAMVMGRLGRLCVFGEETCVSYDHSLCPFPSGKQGGAMCVTVSGVSLAQTSSKSAVRMRGISEGLMRRYPPSNRVCRFMSLPTSKELKSLASGGALYLSSVLMNLFMAMKAGFSIIDVCCCC